MIRPLSIRSAYRVPPEDRCTYLELPSVASCGADDDGDGELSRHWHCVLGLVFCGAFTVTTTTEMLWRATNCFFSCLNSGGWWRPGGGVVPLLRPRQVEHRIFITCEDHHWSLPPMSSARKLEGTREEQRQKKLSLAGDPEKYRAWGWYLTSQDWPSWSRVRRIARPDNDRGL